MVVATVWGRIHPIVHHKNCPLTSVSPRCIVDTSLEHLTNTLLHRQSDSWVTGTNLTPPRPSTRSTMTMPLLVSHDWAFASLNIDVASHIFAVQRQHGANSTEARSDARLPHTLLHCWYHQPSFFRSTIIIPSTLWGKTPSTVHHQNCPLRYLFVARHAKCRDMHVDLDAHPPHDPEVVGH
jgi:hypothetical protein